MKNRIIIAYILNLADLAFTTYWVNKFGLGIEANPIGRWLYQTGMVYPVKIVGMAILFWILYTAIKKIDTPKKEWWDSVSWVVLVAYGVLAVYHIILAIITNVG